MKALLLAVSLIIVSLPSLGNDVKIVGCEMGTIPRCSCPFGMDITCNGFNGHIDDNQKPEYLKVVVMDKSGKEEVYTLNNPPGGAVEYYGSSLGEDEWVINEINKQRKANKKWYQRLSVIDKIDLAQDGLGIKEGTKLYADAYGRNVAGEVSAEAKGGSDWSCWYVNNPIMTNPKGEEEVSCRRSLCVARAKCRREYVTFEATLSCLSKNGECPSATDCAADKEVKSEYPLNRYRIKVGKPKATEAAQ